MKVKLTKVEQGANSRQKIVEISTVDGIALLEVDSSQIQEGMLEVGGPVGMKDKNYLVELPQETFGGSWRVWIPKGQLVGA
jgi:hypothetical protein